ncbi:MAG TPA: hypothetical protein VF575_04275 [Candidatus Saccharimonadales bacterium]|jgi:hypothetical protein
MSSNNSKVSASKSAQPLYKTEWKVLVLVYALLVLFDRFIFPSSWTEALVKTAVIMALVWITSWAISTVKNNKKEK